MVERISHDVIEQRYCHLIKPVYDTNAVTIVYAFDNGYCQFYAVALQSLIDHSTKDRNYDLIILETDISQENKDILKGMIPSNFSLRFFNVSDVITEIFSSVNFKVRSYWNVATYYKCFVPILMHDYDRALFNDADIAYNGNVDALFDMDFEDAKVIGIVDSAANIMETNDKKRATRIHQQGLIDCTRYFNGGVINFNIGAIDAGWYYDRIVDILSNNDLWYQDQDLLNLVFEDKSKIASCVYDYQIVLGNEYLRRIANKEYVDDYRKARENPVIIHYVGAEKPWINRYWPYADVFWRYAKETPYYEILESTDYLKKKNFTGKLISKMMILVCKNMRFDSSLFRLIECIIWPFAWKS